MAAKKRARAGTEARAAVAKKAARTTTKKPAAKAAKKSTRKVEGPRVAKKTVAKKTVAKKTVAKKTVAKKTVAKKTAARVAEKRTAKSAKRPVVMSAAPRPAAPQSPGTVSDYVATLPDAQQHAAAAIRAILQELAPEASESIKWGQPVYAQGGPFAFMKSAKAHLTFGFWRGTELSDPDGLLLGAGDRMRHMKISGGEIPTDAIRAFVGQAILLNAERGDPTRRG